MAISRSISYFCGVFLFRAFLFAVCENDRSYTVTTCKIFTAIAHNHDKCKPMTKIVWFRCLRSMKASAAEKRTITNRRSPHGVKCDETVVLFLEMLGKKQKIHNDINWQQNRNFKQYFQFTESFYFAK